MGIQTWRYDVISPTGGVLPVLIVLDQFHLSDRGVGMLKEAVEEELEGADLFLVALKSQILARVNAKGRRNKQPAFCVLADESV